MTRRTIPCEDILFDDPNDEMYVQGIGNVDVVITEASGEIDGSIAVTAAEEEGTVGVSVVIPNPCATVTEGVLISMPIENHLEGELIVQVLQHDPGTNSDVVIAATTVGTAEDVNLTGIAVGSGDFTLEVVSEAGADFVVGAIHYMTAEQLSENFVIVECNTDNIYGNDYRFGFNGQQKDNELKGLGNSLDFTFRAYDSRLGRPLSIDPLADKFPMLSPYQFFSNNPIWFVDLEGKEGISYREVRKDAESGLTIPIRRVIETDVYIAANANGTKGGYKTTELNTLAYILHTKYNNQGYIDEAGLPVEFRFNFKTFDPETIKPQDKADALWKMTTSTNNTNRIGLSFDTRVGVAMWKEPVKGNGSTVQSSIKIDPDRGIYEYGHAEAHELSHFMLAPHGQTQQTPNAISDHSLGGWMKYGTKRIDEKSGTTKIEGVDFNFSPQTAEKIIQGVPRIDDKPIN